MEIASLDLHGDWTQNSLFSQEVDCWDWEPSPSNSAALLDSSPFSGLFGLADSNVAALESSRECMSSSILDCQPASQIQTHFPFPVFHLEQQVENAAAFDHDQQHATVEQTNLIHLGKQDTIDSWLVAMDIESPGSTSFGLSSGGAPVDNDLGMWPLSQTIVGVNDVGVQDYSQALVAAGTLNKRSFVGGGDGKASKKHCVKTKNPEGSVASKEPQCTAAKNRRERINERIKILQSLIPNGTKVDLVTMLEKAISYVKFLQLQVNVLAADEYWLAPSRPPSDVARVKELMDAISSSQSQ